MDIDGGSDRSVVVGGGYTVAEFGGVHAVINVYISAAGNYCGPAAGIGVKLPRIGSRAFRNVSYGIKMRSAESMDIYKRIIIYAGLAEVYRSVLNLYPSADFYVYVSLFEIYHTALAGHGKTFYNKIVKVNGVAVLRSIHIVIVVQPAEIQFKVAVAVESSALYADSVYVFINAVYRV